MKQMTEMQKELYEDLKFYLAQVERAATDAKSLNMDTDEVVRLIKQNLIENLTGR